MSEIPWIDTAKQFVGTKEGPGGSDNPVILEWAQKIGGFTAQYYHHDEIPWCGLFVGHCLQANECSLPKNPLSALEYANWGQPLKEVTFGAVLVFIREGGGHVGFYVGEDADAYHVLGGNQHDMVNVTRIGKDRLHAMRWPAEWEVEYTGPIVEDFAGPLSVNER